MAVSLAAALISAFATLFVVIDPVGLSTLFIGLTAGASRAARRAIAIEASLIAFLVLTGAALFGQWLLTALGINIASFRIAGGLLLFAIAYEMVFEKRQERKASTAEPDIAYDAHHSPAAFPLAIPLMAGPGAITAVILLAGRAAGNWLLLGLYVGIIAAVILICFAVFLLSGQIERILGRRGQVVLARLLGVLLAALAVQYVADGVIALKAL